MENNQLSIFTVFQDFYWSGILSVTVTELWHFVKIWLSESESGEDSDVAELKWWI